MPDLLLTVGVWMLSIRLTRPLTRLALRCSHGRCLALPQPRALMKSSLISARLLDYAYDVAWLS